MTILPSALLRQDYNSISKKAKETMEPIYITKNGMGDIVVMNIEAFERREKMLALKEELLRVEEERLHGQKGKNMDETFSTWDALVEKM